MKIKHFCSIIICIIIFALLCGSYMFVFSKRNDVNIELEKVKGDESVLRDVAIKGDIKDKNHTISFTMLNGKIEKTFKYKCENYSGRKNSEMQNFEGTEKEKPYYNLSSRRKYIYTENAEYFVKISDENSWGIDGVFQSGIKNEATGEYESLGGPQHIFLIDLQNGRVKIKYANSVENNIVVILSIDGLLYANVIDPEQKKLLSEIEIGEDYSDINDEMDYFDGVEVNGYYILRQLENRDENLFYNFYVIDIENKKTVQTIKVKRKNIFNDKYRRNWINNNKVLYKNDILYILYDYIEIQETNGRIYNIPMLMINAYKDGKKVYEGEIVTDAKFDDHYDNTIYSESTRTYSNMRME